MQNDFYIPPQPTRWIAVDLDGTIAYSTWRPEQAKAVVGDVIPENLAKLTEAVEMGFEAVIYTSRPWSQYELIKAWLEENAIPYHSIVCGKLQAKHYIDNRAINSRDERWY